MDHHRTLRLLLFHWLALGLVPSAGGQSTDTPDHPAALVRIETHGNPAPQILFDFRWAADLHRYLDAWEAQDHPTMQAHLQAWSETQNGSTLNDRIDRALLISILQHDRSLLDQMLLRTLDRPGLSWSSLLALEQICQRLDANSRKSGATDHAFTAALEKLHAMLETRCEAMVDGYLRGAFWRAELSSHVCQAANRLSDDARAVRLIKLAGSAIQQRSQQLDVALLSLQCERWLRLVARDATTYREPATVCCTLLCEQLQREPEFLRTHPLALAKAYYNLAQVLTQPVAQYRAYSSAVQACEQATFDPSTIPERWYWEARRLVKQSAVGSPDEQVALLFRYQQTKLKSSAQLDRYLLASGVHQGLDLPNHHQMMGQDVDDSLAQLQNLQTQLNIGAIQRLVVLMSRVDVLQSIKSSIRSNILDQAMQLAWELRDQAFTEPDVEELILSCQTEWIVTRATSLNSSRAGLSDQPGMHSAIQHLKKDRRLVKYPKLAERLSKAELVWTLASGELDLIKNFINELSLGSSLPSDILSSLSLELLLAIRAADLDEAQVIAQEIRCRLVLQPEEARLFALYALAELELEQGDASLVESRAILELHATLNEMIKTDTGSDDSRRDLASLQLENALQLAMAYHVGDEEVKQTSQRLVDSLTGPTAGPVDLRILSYLSDSPRAVPALTRFRARVALAAELQRSWKHDQTVQRVQQHQYLREEYRALCALLAEEQARHKQQTDLMKRTVASANELTQAKADQSRWEELNQQFSSQQREELALREKVEQLRQEVLQSYDRLFRPALPTTEWPERSDELQSAVRSLSEYLELDDQSDRFLNARFNARCLVLEAAIAFGPTAIDYTAEQIRRCALVAVQDALRIRQRWSRFQQRGPAEARQRLFDRYQLGFELAIRWFAQQGEIEQAIRLAALTTNRSFAEFNDQATFAQEDLAHITLPDQLLAYYSGNESLHVFWRLSNKQWSHAESLVNRTTLETAIHQLVTKYGNKATVDLSIEQRLLAGWLLPQPLCATLIETNPNETEPACLYVAPHGPLFQLPLEALPLLGGDSRLGQLRPLIYLPTLAAARRSENKQTSKPTQSVLTIQPDPEVGKESTSFPAHFSTEEVIRLANPACTVTAVKAELRNRAWEIVHVGAHARAASEETAKAAAIQLNKEPLPTHHLNTDDLTTADLTTADLSEIQLSARHVWLSACETQTASASDLRSGGNTLKTLGTTFLAIGAQDVIAAHWRVNNDSTTEMFNALIKAYAETDPNQRQETEAMARLLFKARNQLTSQAQYSHPYFWNAFTIWTVPR